MTPAQISQYAASPIRYGQPPETVARPLGSPQLRADASVPKTYDLGGWSWVREQYRESGLSHASVTPGQLL